MTSPIGHLVPNFRPLAGGFKCDVEIQFFAYLFLGAIKQFIAPNTIYTTIKQWENNLGAQEFKSRLFLNRSNEQHCKPADSVSLRGSS